MGVKQIGTLVLDELVASPKVALLEHTITLTGTAGATLKRGQLIGKKVTTSDSTTTTTYGAMATGFTAYGILAEDVTFGASATTAKAIVYVSGHFNGNKVTGYDANYYDDLRAVGVYVDKAIAY